MDIRIGKSFWINLKTFNQVVYQFEKVVLPDEIKKKMEKAEQTLAEFINNRMPVYGVNTQFGDDANRIQVGGDDQAYAESLIRRQRNLIYALNCAVGPECSEDIIRGTLFLRANAHAQAASGIRVEVTEAIIQLLNQNILPIMLRYGSVGASGDLIPQSAIALTLMGENKVRYQGKVISAEQGLKEIGLKPFVLQMKEGLAIVNGTSFCTAIAAIAIHKLCYLLPLSIAVTAVCAEAMLAMDSGYQTFVHTSKHHQSQVFVAKFIRECWKGSQLIRSLDNLRETWRDEGKTKTTQEHAQDYYSLRGIAQGFGPFVDTLKHAVHSIEEEMNSANDNPLINAEEKQIYHCANFLTDYVAVACDQLRADVAKGSTWMHAILGNLVNPRKNRDLSPNLTVNPVEHTGFKAIQLLVASLTIHNRSRTLPVSSVMLPTEGDNQDMVGLGPQSAFALLEVTENYACIVAAMLLAAAQAIEMRGVKESSEMARKIHAFVRQKSLFLKEDRPLSDDLKNLTNAIQNNDQLIKPWFLNEKENQF